MAPNFEAPTSIPVPSADLINYRFDQTDKKFEDMSNKLDQILVQNSHFITESEVKKLISDSIQPTKDTLNDWRWYWRAMFSAIVVALAASVINFFVHKG